MSGCILTCLHLRDFPEASALANIAASREERSAESSPASQTETKKKKIGMKKTDEDDLAEHYVKVACGVDELLRRMHAPADDDYAIN